MSALEIMKPFLEKEVSLDVLKGRNYFLFKDNNLHKINNLKYNHLERRNHTYYFRYWIPKWVRQFFDKTCIRYSLNTNDYNIAVHLVKINSKYKSLPSIDTF